MSGRVLVAGVGNIFLADDGFGVEVARRLSSETLPDGVEVSDFGIRGVHLAYHLLEGYDTLILVDTVSCGEAPGTVTLLEPDLDALHDVSIADAHGMDPESVLRIVQTLGGKLGQVFVVGCEPAEIVERIGLSEPVARAVEEAARMVRQILAERSEAMTPHTAPAARKESVR